tara:strand:+ start:1633 stop:2043 length:411 start_codon:yes stop_codon:yes gene_type:complete
MSKHISPDCFYNLPSGINVHPCRLIHKDGTLMWKHALLHSNMPSLPECEAHEAHIVKTAQRLEELNSWVSVDMEAWECLMPVAWYVPDDAELEEGIAVYFKHKVKDIDAVYTALKSHILSHEILEIRNQYLYFRRC